MPGKDDYKVIEFLSDLQAGIWSELPTGKSIDVYRRQIQLSYIQKMDNLINPKEISAAVVIGSSSRSFPTEDNDFVDVISSTRASLKSLQKDIAKGLTLTSDTMSRIHLEDMSRRIKEILEPKR